MAFALGATIARADDERNSGNLVEQLSITTGAAAVPLSASELADMRGRGKKLFIGNLPITDVPEQMAAALQSRFGDGGVIVISNGVVSVREEAR